ncbi:iron-containing alcohol dehydrogenase [Oceanobacillus jeddahense]|uniref:Iron-containing alcohol dehydrogenase n=1 Tax=Oceanobacillus jeddahense TaxID=1462527 RepID=A0ABY5JZ75_9BACI|nr:1-propanol dehydrogenase PduQ [Oceanobacillus jeddahense]UUI03819.1 iron-containing alcohol dehydrogenase [Oceanobacillus jeddahense]
MKKVAFQTDIYYGKNALDYLKTIHKQRIFIVLDPFLQETKILEKIEDYLSTGNNTWQLFAEVVPDPPIENVTAGVEAMRDFEPDFVITIGGGSAMDAAKAIKDIAKKVYAMEELPLLAIPTTSGTGSEVTSYSVITDQNKGVKYPLTADSLIPETTILDVELVKTVPKSIVADTGMDALTHAVEAYVAKNANDFSDAMAEKAIRLLFDYLPKSYQNEQDDEAKEKVHHASTLAGFAFNTAGLGINHSIAHASGARFHIPHGRLNAILLPSVIAFNAGVHQNDNQHLTPAADRYAALARLLNLPATNQASGVRSFIKEVEKLRKKLDIPANLKAYQLEYNDEIETEIVEASLNDSCTSMNPVKPTYQDIAAILKKIR